MLESYTEGDELVLARNDDYWGTPTPFPGVTFKQVKDATAQLQQLQQGDVDIAMQISFDSVGQLEGVEGVTTELVDSYNFVYLGMSPGAAGGEALEDPNVREAIKLALDYEGILDTTVGGNGKLQASPIPNGFEGSEGLPLPEQDVERRQAAARPRPASDRLDAARRLPDGQRLRRRLRHDDGQGPAGPVGDRRRARAGAAGVRRSGSSRSRATTASRSRPSTSHPTTSTPASTCSTSG